MRRVVLESPYAGDVDRNLEYLGRCVRDCLQRGESPYASHGLLTRFLDDNVPEERELGIRANLAWGSRSDAIVVYLDRGLSKGMRIALEYHVSGLKPVEARLLDPAGVLRFDYTNYRGETARRSVRLPRFYWGATEYHPTPQLLLEAFCLDREALRVFAVGDMEVLPSAAA